ncbi:Sodium transport ATPase 1 [Ceratocystis fimbriata CBS 114723]|uniref:P-type Na(+) transporter n=1 Tax=Ceratocystis fimbriata CBS 114723 TaxID=1035309 RepID=A0A2C5X1C2_9PEZI|nr:Sodium transport ATPase 1 [Ceratocystis fimbriata CBS 114723]
MSKTTADFKHPFLLSVEDTARDYSTNVDAGLTSSQVSQLQSIHPPNELDIGDGVAWYKILSKQLLNAMILVLFFVMVLSYAFKDWIEGGVVTVVIILNVAIGFWQEYKAEKKMDALRALSSPSATVLRDGVSSVVPNAQVVPGDIVYLKMGDTVPADVRLFEAMNLACDEQSLTGEALPVDKITENTIIVPGTDRIATEDSEVGIGDRINIAYATTTVKKGRGAGIVIATGMTTEVGKIASSSTKKNRKPGRSMNYKKYGKRQAAHGVALTAYDKVGKFLGLTEGTPLQRKLAGLAYVLFGCALLLAVVVFGVNEFHVPNEVVIYATSLGIAIIPESLVAVLTITMVVAVSVMNKANVVVRDLSALEALGGVTNICSDKTGTLTQGSMIVRKAWLPKNHLYTVHESQNPSDPTQGHVTHQEYTTPKPEPKQERNFDEERSALALKFDVPEEKLNAANQASGNDAAGNKEPKEEPATVTPALRAFLLSSGLCNLANVRYDDDSQKWTAAGEPTEVALQVFALRFQYGRKALQGKGWKQVAEFPFDSSIKRMSVIYNAPIDDDSIEGCAENSIVFTKGAVERVLDLCSHFGYSEDRTELTNEIKDEIMEQMSALASQGQRVLCIAYRKWDGRYVAEEQGADDSTGENSLRNRVEQGLTFLGLVGIYDPPRRETKMSIAECSTAGIRVHMLTGDHPDTAKAIAKEVGIIPKNLSVLPDSIKQTVVVKATEFDKMTDEEIDAMEELPLVIARCAPNTKTRMIEALRRRGAFMAMTGDGVNDAPSLSAADVGIAMGSGSDVAKSASKIVLTDDKFNSIVAAIREGRRMFDNIQKFVLHLLTSNVGEVILLVAGLGFRDSRGYSVFPVSPLEILWINMVTSSFPAFGLGREGAASNVMRKPPHDKNRGVFTNQILVDMIVYGVLMGFATIMTFVIIVYGNHDGNLGNDCNKKWSESCRPVFRARAAVFAELTWLILLSAWEFKDLRRSAFRLNDDETNRLSVFKDMYANKFLFYSVVIGMLSVFPVVYIPGLNTNVFKHRGISWEWGLVVGFTIFFIAGIEAWKLIKRRFHLLEDRPVKRGAYAQGSSDETTGTFGRSMTMVSFKSWRTLRRSETKESRASSSRRKRMSVGVTPV